MAEYYQKLNERLRNFISRQKIFFIATCSDRGKINLSPKCLDTFVCIDNSTIAYLDLMGSGNETATNVMENSRMTVMFCSFDEDPMILRLFGKGEVILQDEKKWAEYREYFPDIPGKRQIIVLNIGSVQTSCGSSVPIYEYKRERTRLHVWPKQGIMSTGRRFMKKIFGISYCLFSKKIFFKSETF